MFKGLMIAAAAAVGLSGAASASTFTFFESFEVPDLSSGWFVFQEVGDAGNGDWKTLSGAGIEIQSSGVVVDAQDGDQYVELDSDNNTKKGGLPNVSEDSQMAHVFQDLSKGDYAVTFYYQPRTGAEDDNAITAGVYDWNGALGALVGNSITVGYGSTPGVTNAYTETRPTWQKFSFGFSLDQTQTVALAFTSVPGARASYGGFLDSVSVNAVPEPATWLMMIAGFALVGFNLKRRKADTLAA